MSDKLVRPRDEEIEKETEYIFSDFKKNKSKVLFNSFRNRNNTDNNRYKVINLKESPKKRIKMKMMKVMNIVKKMMKKVEKLMMMKMKLIVNLNKEKKRKLDNIVGVWSRKKSDIKDIENDESQLSADIIINKPENKTDKIFDFFAFNIFKNYILFITLILKTEN